MISLPDKITFTFAMVLLCFTLSKISSAQSQLYLFQSVVVDEKLEPIGGAYIKNMGSNEFAITDTAGSFSIECHIEDSLLITAMGYELKKIYVDERSSAFVQLRYVFFELKQVNVYDFKSWEAFKEAFLETEIPGEKVNTKGLPHGKPSVVPTHLRSNTFEEKPTVFHFLVSPFSSLAYFLNEDEKSKRKVWNMMKLENREMIYWKIMTADSLQSWIDIPDSTIYDFIFYCNQKIENKKQDVAYYYKEKIIQLYPLYLAEKQGAE